MSLTTTLAALFATEFRATLRRNIQLGAIYGAAALGLIGAIGFGLAALHRLISETQGPIQADLIIGVGLLIFAGILVGIAQYIAQRARRRAALTSAMMAAPIAAGAMLKKPKIGFGALIAIVALTALAGRTMSK